MQKTFSIFYSRTFWTIIAMFIVGGGNAIVPVIPAQGQAILTAALSLAAMYFHFNPSQSYPTDSIR